MMHYVVFIVFFLNFFPTQAVAMDTLGCAKPIATTELPQRKYLLNDSDIPPDVWFFIAKQLMQSPDASYKNLTTMLLINKNAKKGLSAYIISENNLYNYTDATTEAVLPTLLKIKAIWNAIKFFLLHNLSQGILSRPLVLFDTYNRSFFLNVPYVVKPDEGDLKEKLRSLMSNILLSSPSSQDKGLYYFVRHLNRLHHDHQSYPLPEETDAWHDLLNSAHTETHTDQNISALQKIFIQDLEVTINILGLFGERNYARTYKEKNDLVEKLDHTHHHLLGKTENKSKFLCQHLMIFTHFLSIDYKKMDNDYFLRLTYNPDFYKDLEDFKKNFFSDSNTSINFFRNFDKKILPFYQKALFFNNEKRSIAILKYFDASLKIDIEKPSLDVKNILDRVFDNIEVHGRVFSTTYLNCLKGWLYSFPPQHKKNIDANIYFKIGKIHLFSREYQKAFDIYKRALEHHNESSSASTLDLIDFYCNFGKVCMHLRQYNQAKEAFHKNIEAYKTLQNKGSLDLILKSYFSLGYTHIALKEYAKTKNICKEIVDFFEKNSNAKQFESLYSQAEESYRQLINLNHINPDNQNPDIAEIYKYLNIIKTKLKRGA